ncbi:hypothetical protein DTL42_04015 [Bremerella cremea]|uniref:Uncharacterized protein n=1 Tax=Bremerella cremea TaxID=1031537 RepID=A0A368KVC4_9BACT|nr:hypothetical protein [Bremerella cremea]RCS54319.1 hypothetical protein DTL42_04015 [Bremerella cremea]
MHSFVCVLAVLAAPPTLENAKEVTTVATEVAESAPLKPHEIRQALRTTLKSEAASETFADRRTAIERLCYLFQELMLSEDFAELDRQKWRARLVSRFRSIQDDLEKLPRETTETRSLSQDGARGGAALDQRGADELINLITTTIDPETWENLGGNGSIFYYSNLQVLVIRQTQEVHEKIGGINRGLRSGP